MIDREKVIKAIEYCTEDSLICHGDKCPYWQDGVSNIVCWKNVMKDAGELLKADQAELIRQREHIESLEGLIESLEELVDQLEGR